MSGEALYERYKDALKRGHVASLRGRLEEALTAYAEAAAIAPERPTPHTSAGTALMRRKRPADALRHYTAALRLAPRDEAALLGRAQALSALDRRPEAADAYDALAEVRAGSGKLADAVDAARRGLELAEGRERRRTLEDLMARLRATDPGEPGRATLERALRVLEGPTVGELHAVAASADAVAPEAGAAPGAADAEAAPAEAETAPGSGAGDATLAEAAPVEAVEDASVEPESSVPAIRSALDRDVPEGVDAVALGAAAEEAALRGDPDAVDRLLDVAAVHRREGRTDAALDACYLALSVVPDDLGLHLGLVELFDERGWSVLAVEKLDLLDRLVALEGDEEAAERVAAARAARG